MKHRTGVEKLDHSGAGYLPLLIRPGWQVARLNHMPDLTAEAINRIECHHATDEVFILCKGSAVLITAAESGHGLIFETCRMEPCVLYNIPAGVWHTIAMTEKDVVMIIERDNTHLNDVTYRDLTAPESALLQATTGKRPPLS